MFNRSLPPRQQRSKFILLWFVILLVSSLIGLPLPTRAAPASPNQAFLAVQFNPHDRLVRSISFSGSITGLDALLQSGLDIVTNDYGGGFIAVCSIEGVGCPATDCFCGGSTFWNYEYWDGNQWQSHSSGASGYTVQNGAVEGWRWGEWTDRPILPWPQLDSARKALDWLRSQQNSDGGFGSVSSSVEAALAIGSNHEAAKDWRIASDAKTLADYLTTQSESYSRLSAASAGKLSVAMVKSGMRYPDNAKKPNAYYDNANGQFGDGSALNQSWALLGTLALEETVPDDAISYLKSIVKNNEGWGWSLDRGVDTNTTALALQSLLANHEMSCQPLIRSVLAYLHKAQNDDGGFPYDLKSTSSTPSDADSTAYVLQALYALGEDPTSDAWKKNGNSPLDFLTSLQLSDGSFKWTAKEDGDKLRATQQAIPALLGRPMPFTTTGVDPCWNTFMPVIK